MLSAVSVSSEKSESVICSVSVIFSFVSMSEIPSKSGSGKSCKKDESEISFWLNESSDSKESGEFWIVSPEGVSTTSSGAFLTQMPNCSTSFSLASESKSSFILKAIKNSVKKI